MFLCVLCISHVCVVFVSRVLFYILAYNTFRYTHTRTNTVGSFVVLTSLFGLFLFSLFSRVGERKGQLIEVWNVYIELGFLHLTYTFYVLLAQTQTLQFHFMRVF